MGKWQLNIFMVVPGMPFDGNTTKERSLGGSETAGLCMARELATLGHNVTVLANLPGEEQEVDGVFYVSIQKGEEMIQKVPHDILIVQREPRWFALNTASKINVLWNHDLATKTFAGIHQAAMWNVDWVFLLSKFHAEQAKGTYPFLDDEQIRLTRNGIDLDNFPKVQNKVPGKVMYGARPERGLINLVAEDGIMERLYQLDPKIQLYVVSYDNTVPQMAQFYGWLRQRCDQLPNVTILGHLPKKMLYEQYAEAELYLYPTQFEEISCITAMECMACGTPMVTSRIAALPETLGEKTSIFLDAESSFGLLDRLPPDYIDKFIGATLGLLQDKDRRRQLSFQCRERAKNFGWTGVAKQWETLFFERFAEATTDREKLVSHFLYHDDLMMARQIAEKEQKKIVDAKLDWALDEQKHRQHYDGFSQNEFKDRDPEHVARHYDRVFLAEPRWEMLKEWFRDKEIKEGAKVLDVGCGPGYFSVGMANEFGVDVVGIDISNRYVEEAKSLKSQRMINGHGLFVKSDNPIWKANAPFDVIVISEVIEHIGYMEPVDFVRQFEEYLAVDGWFVITTPFGPLKKATPVREKMHHDLHVRHFERADIHELFGKKQGFDTNVIYWQHTNTTKELLGWYMYSFQQGGEYGEIDLERKKTVQIPRDRLSVCMIAKNEQAIIRKALESIVDIADEIIVADTGSTDSTVEICQEYGARVIQGADPLKEGFEIPRNQSIESAIGDWILWIDADEGLQGACNLPKYLRNSPYNGFRIRQHHFSCQPVEATTIDKPVRVFRNLPRVRFWGLIHEHPGFDCNEGMGQVVELADVDIAHYGYYTETGRRAKFWRNLNMMMADIEKYPDRYLGRWLYMRDLMHLISWSIEQTGQVTEAARIKAHEVIQIYRNNFLHLGGHMALDGLQYYSGALKILNMGYDFTWSVGVNNGKAPDRIMVGRFADKEDFKVFLNKTLDDRAWFFEGKYSH